MKKNESVSHTVFNGKSAPPDYFFDLIQADVLSKGENHSSLCSIDNETTNLNQTASFFFFSSVSTHFTIFTLHTDNQVKRKLLQINSNVWWSSE